MSQPSLVRVCLWLFLAFLLATALMAIAVVLQNGPGDTGFRVLASAATISVASACAMACAAFRTRTAWPRLGDLGILSAVVAGIALLVLVWSGQPSRPAWKLVSVLVPNALAFAHVELLWLPRLQSSHRPVQFALTVAAALFALLSAYVMVAEANDHGLFRLLGVLGIVVALLTLLVPLLWKLGTTATGASASARLVLTRTPVGTWADAAGQRYTVTPLAPVAAA